MRNASLGFLVKASQFPAVPGVADPLGDTAFFVIMLYGGVVLPMALPLLFYGRRGGGKAS